jgi:hypothetical protein
MIFLGYVLVMADGIIRDFGLDIRNALFLGLEDFSQIQAFPSDWPPLDNFVVAFADAVYPVAIRPRGNLEAILNTLRVSSGKVNEQFAIPYGKVSRKVRFKIGMELLANGNPQWDVLTHWTRAATGPWPGETKADFYMSFNEGGAGYPRNALHTLRRILQERRIRASKQLVRGGEAVVSLTACPPWELAKLVKWRPGLFRWTFEPYGIALNRERLASLGARPVVYGEDYQFRFLQEVDRPFFQSCGHDKNNWRIEKEWRYLGDLDLSRFAPDEVVVIAFAEDEAAILQEESPFPVVHWADIPKKCGSRSSGCV